MHRVGDLGGFLAGFTDHIVAEPRWAAHIGGHPPAAFGTFVLLDRIGLAGPVWAAVLCLAVELVTGFELLATDRAEFPGAAGSS